MDIGTGKDLSDYIVKGKHIPYHLIDIREAGEKYSLFHFQRDFHEAYFDILSRKKAYFVRRYRIVYRIGVKGYRLLAVPARSIEKTIGE